MDEANGEIVVHLNGKTYNGAELINYLEEHKAELTEQGVLEQIAEKQEELGADEERDKKTYGDLGTFVLVREEPEFSLGKKMILYQGDALFMAILCRKYDLANVLLKQPREYIIGGSSVMILNAEGSIPILGMYEHEGLLGLLLEDELLPEELWKVLWADYSRVFKADVFFIEESKYRRVFGWLGTLERIKRNRPGFFREMVTEHFLSELLWTYTVGYEGITEAEEAEFCRKWKKVFTVPIGSEMFINKLWAGITGYGLNENRIERARCFARLWKRMNGRGLVLDFGDVSPGAERIRKRLENNPDNYEEAWFDVLFEITDVIEHAECVDWKGIFRYAIKENKSVGHALKVDLITKGMIPEAVKYARKHAPDRIALLVLKQHGEFKPMSKK